VRDIERKKERKRKGEKEREREGGRGEQIEREIETQGGAPRRDARDGDGTRRAVLVGRLARSTSGAERSGAESKQGSHRTVHHRAFLHARTPARPLARSLARSPAITLNPRQDGGRGGGGPVRAPRARHRRQDPRDRRVRVIRHPRGVLRPRRQVLPRRAPRRY